MKYNKRVCQDLMTPLPAVFKIKLPTETSIDDYFVT